MVGEKVQPGTEAWYASDSPSSDFSAVFEDDGDTGYLYAYQRGGEQGRILDAIHVYNAAAVRATGALRAEIIWSADGSQAAFLLDGRPHAIIDFPNRRVYSRTEFPSPSAGWQHAAWDDSLMTHFGEGPA